MKTVALYNLGCKVNSYETEGMGQKLRENGYEIVPFEEKADIYIVNTCTVTNIADRKSRQMLHRAKQLNPDAVVVAAGCYVQTGLANVEKDAGIDLAVGNNHKKDIVELLERYLEERRAGGGPGAQASKTLSGAAVMDMNRNCEYEEMQLRQTTEHTRAYIKIQDGCNQFCSYCVIPYARGRVRSRRAEDILQEIRGLVVAAGCYVQTGLANVEKDAGIDLAVGNNHKKDIVELLERYLEERRAGGGPGAQASKTLSGAAVMDMNRNCEYEEMQLRQTTEHTRAYIKIQDGCNQFCSYCVIPYARGRVRSRRAEDILQEIRGLVDAGYREAVLTGIHISSYGIDFPNEPDRAEAGGDVRKDSEGTGRSAGELASGNGGDTRKRGPGYNGSSKLIELIEQIHEIPGLDRIRLGSLEPRIISEDTVRRLAALPKLCPHFHLSLQSGCDATLKRMNRHYTSGEYYNSVEILRRFFDHPAITTDVIVGFPGETEEEFALTKSFLNQVNFYEIHVFKYSRRTGTAADAKIGRAHV